MLINNKYGRLLEKVYALCAAAKQGLTNAVSAVIEKHPEVFTEGFMTASNIASRYGQFEILQQLLKNTEVESPHDCQELFDAALDSSHGDIADSLLKRFTPKGFFDARYLTNALTAAALDGKDRCVQVLLDNGARPDHTALAQLIKSGATESSLRLLKAGCAVNGQYFIDRSSPLHLAASSGLGEVMRHLLAGGADPALRDRRKQTPLHIAAMLGRQDCTAMLLKHELTDILAEDQYDELAFDNAEEIGHTEVAGQIRKSWRR
ncbi:hypothetical protein PWT90_10707 [Aphanocladium album]|nr:hypothetical protein PWT90_10707 [Aphanocladium album]